MRRKLSQGIAAVAVAVTITGGVAGCGVVNKLSDKQKVSKAVSSFQDAESASFTIKLDTTPADLKKISEVTGTGWTAEDQEMTPKILAGDIQYAVHAADGKKLGDSSNSIKTLGDVNTLLQDPAKFGEALKQAGDFAFAVHQSGEALVEFRFVDGIFYGRAAVPKILELAGEDPSVVDSQLAQLPPALAPIKVAAKGQWVSLDLAAVMQTLKDEGALDGLAIPTTGPTPSIDSAAVQKLINDLKAAYEKNVTITKLESSDRGQEYQLTAKPKDLAAAIKQDIVDIAGDASAADIDQAITEIPDKPINVNVWVKDDKLTGVALDITQFLDEKVDAKLALDVTVNLDGGEIGVPSGATALDVKALLDEVKAQTSGGFSTGGGFTDPSTDPFGTDDPFSTDNPFGDLDIPSTFG